MPIKDMSSNAIGPMSNKTAYLYMCSHCSTISGI